MELVKVALWAAALSQGGGMRYSTLSISKFSKYAGSNSGAIVNLSLTG